MIDFGQKIKKIFIVDVLFKDFLNCVSKIKSRTCTTSWRKSESDLN